MARRLLSLPVDDEAGPRIGGSGTEVRLYDEFALSTLSTLYADEAIGTTVPNPIIPNAGFQTDLTVTTGAGDTVITVRDVSGFAIGNLVPIYDGSSTRYRVITAINAGAKQLTLATAVGAIYTAGPTLVGNPDMVGHVHAWLDDTRDYFLQTKDVASTRVLPPVVIPVRIPLSSVSFMEEGVSTGSARAVLNFIGTALTAVDNPGASRVDVTHGTLVAHTGLLQAASFDDTAHGVRAIANAHGFGQISGTITDAQHGVRTLASAHAFTGISGTLGAAQFDDTAHGTRTVANAHGFGQISGTITDAQHGARTGPADAHELADITGLADHNARHEPGGADPMAVDAAAATGSLRTLGTGALQAAVGSHTHTGATLTYAEANVASDVAMTNANQFYDGPSVSLAAGTWFIIGNIMVNRGAGDHNATAKLWDGTTTESSSGQAVNTVGVGTPVRSLTVSGIVVLGGTTTMKISVASSVAGKSIIATVPDNGAGANACHIRAVQIA